MLEDLALLAYSFFAASGMWAFCIMCLKIYSFRALFGLRSPMRLNCTEGYLWCRLFSRFASRTLICRVIAWSFFLSLFSWPPFAYTTPLFMILLCLILLLAYSSIGPKPRGVRISSGLMNWLLCRTYAELLFE